LRLVNRQPPVRAVLQRHANCDSIAADVAIEKERPGRKASGRT